VPEVFGEPKTPQGFLFKNMDAKTAAIFEKRVLRVAAV